MAMALGMKHAVRESVAKHTEIPVQVLVVSKTEDSDVGFVKTEECKRFDAMS